MKMVTLEMDKEVYERAKEMAERRNIAVAEYIKIAVIKQMDRDCVVVQVKKWKKG